MLREIMLYPSNYLISQSQDIFVEAEISEFIHLLFRSLILPIVPHVTDVTTMFLMYSNDHYYLMHIVPPLSRIFLFIRITMLSLLSHGAKVLATSVFC